MAMDTKPSQGFWGKLGGGLKQHGPAALNAMAQNMGGAFSPAAALTGSIMQARNKKKKSAGTDPDVQGKQTTQQNGPQGMSPVSTGSMPYQQGMVRGPSRPMFAPPPMQPQFPMMGAGMQPPAGGMMQPMGMGGMQPPNPMMGQRPSMWQNYGM